MRTKFNVKDIKAILQKSFKEWNDDDAFTHAAAVSYYAIFSLPAILLLLINIAGVIWDKSAVQGKISSALGQTIGQDAAQQIQNIASNSSQSSNSTIMMILGIAVLVISATGLFIQLQKALNNMWEVKTRSDAGLLKVIFDRTKTFGIILTVGFLLLISMAITGLLSALSSWITTILPDFTIYFFHLLNFIISLGIVTVLFALIFKFLPDVRIGFKSVWVGAFVTAFLFMIGQYAMSLYFSIAEPASAYGVAGTIILILLWVYYSCLLLFFGAEFTQAYAQEYGHTIEPSRTAIKIEPCLPLDPKGSTT